MRKRAGGKAQGNHHKETRKVSSHETKAIAGKTKADMLRIRFYCPE